MSGNPEDAGVYCGECGYNLTGLTRGVCPECGAAIAERAGEEAVDEAWETRKLIAALCIVLGGVNFLLLLFSVMGAALSERGRLAATVVVLSVLLTGSLIYSAGALAARRCPAWRLRAARWAGLATGGLVTGHQLVVYPVLLWGRAGAWGGVLGVVTSLPAAAYVVLSYRVLRPGGLPEGPLRWPELLGVRGRGEADVRGRNEGSNVD